MTERQIVFRPRQAILTVKAEHVATFLRRNQDLLANIADPFVPGVQGRRLLSLVNEDKLRRILARMLDEERFLGADLPGYEAYCREVSSRLIPRIW